MDTSTRSLVEYDIYVPTVLDPSDPESRSELLNIRERLVNHFGGLTDKRLHNEGLWKIGAITVRDEVVVWRVLSDKGTSGDKEMVEVKKMLEKLLHQDVILIVKREVQVLE